MKKYLGLSYFGSLLALGTAACCVLPVTMMLFGLGGGWLAIFGRIAEWSYLVLAISTLLVLLAAAVSFKRGSMGKLRWWILGSATITASAWIVLFNETRINDFQITLM